MRRHNRLRDPVRRTVEAPARAQPRQDLVHFASQREIKALPGAGRNETAVHQHAQAGWRHERKQVSHGSNGERGADNEHRVGRQRIALQPGQHAAWQALAVQSNARTQRSAAPVL